MTEPFPGLRFGMSDGPVLSPYLPKAPGLNLPNKPNHHRSLNTSCQIPCVEWTEQMTMTPTNSIQFNSIQYDQCDDNHHMGKGNMVPYARSLMKQ